MLQPPTAARLVSWRIWITYPRRAVHFPSVSRAVCCGVRWRKLGEDLMPETVEPWGTRCTKGVHVGTLWNGG